KDKARYLPSLRPDHSNWQQMLASLSQLYTAGIAINWTAFSQDYSHKKVLLPTYPFQRQRYWVEPADTSEPRPKSLAASQNGHPLLGQKLISPVPPTQFQNQVSVDCPHYLTDHRVFGQAILPATAYVEIALAAVSRGNNQSITLTDFDIQRGLILAEDSPVTLQTILAEQNDGTHQFKIFSLAESDSEKMPDEKTPEEKAPEEKAPEEKAPEEKAPQWICHAQGTLETTESPLPAAVDLEAQKANFLQPIPVETYYQKLRDRGLEYGQNFQAIQQLWSAPNQALAEIHLPDILEDLPYRLHPVLLDASFQTLAAAIGETSTTHTYLPTQIEQLTLYAPIPRQVWAIGSLSLNPQNPKQLIGTLQLTDAAGNLLAEVKGLILKQTNKELLLRFLRPALPPSLYQLRWKKAPLVSAPLPILPTEPENWLIFTTETVSEISAQLIEQLQQQGHNCILVSPATRYHSENEHTYQLDPTNPEDFHQLLQSLDSQHSTIKGIVQLWGIPPEPSDPASKQDTGCTATLHLVQALSKARIASNLWILTQGAQLIAGTSTNQSIAQVQQSTLWGLGRVIALEHPELKCKSIDLSPDNNQPPQLIQELLTPDAEDQIAYHNNDRYIARLDSYDPTQPAEGSALTIPASPFQLKLTEYGLIDNLALQPIQRRSPAPHDVEIQVSAAGLNFRDVLNVLGLLKDYYAENLGITHANQLTFGFECAGTIVAKGDQVSHLQIGDDVIATMLTDGVSRFVTTRSEFVIPKPAHITFAEAATLPLAFLTAYYGLHHLARLQPGDKVLIHAAAGGVGQAAVQIAQKAGAEIFATASPAKWNFLKEQGIAHIMNSRNLDFATEVMTLTEGKGVDVVLNSLNGEYIDKSFEALAPYGRFVELGKIGIWERDRVSSTYPGAHYFPFDLGEVTKANPTLIRDLWLELSTHFQQKHFRPLPIKTFPIQSSIQAFRHMQQAKHIGKVILTLPNEQNRTAIDPNSNYLITGGLGALGLKVAQWIANQGAAHITLTGRSTPSTQAISAIEEIKSIGTEISILLGDISNQQDVHSIFQQLKTEDFPPLKGIIHAAGVLQDGLLSQLTWAEFEKVMAPKVQGTWHLHHLTKSLPLDFFVCFSSIASLLGSPGQSNYSAANAFADALMQYRRAHNLPGLSINWGPWANVGMAAQQDTSIQDRLQARGVNPLTPEQALEILEQLLTPHSQPSAQVGAFSIDWPKFTAQLPPGVSLPVLEQFKLAADDTQGDRLKGLEQLKQIPTAQRREHLMHHIQAEIADVLGYDSPEEIALDQPLGDLGVDSLMAVELANQLEYNLGPTIPASFLFEHPTLEGLVEYLIEQMPEIEF
ncbi:MAG: SDR family NAD(P)-dependent oxidoreductase, partial [Cyanobacteria bacterium J06560_2]